MTIELEPQHGALNQLSIGLHLAAQKLNFHHFWPKNGGFILAAI
jgi:hypothetical protein